MQGLGFALVGAIGQLLCRGGSHPDEPVSVDATPGAEYVLLRCERCGRDRPLIGQAARDWIKRFMPQ